MSNQGCLGRPVVTVTDKNYVVPTFIFLNSLVKKIPNEVEIFVICTDKASSVQISKWIEIQNYVNINVIEFTGDIGFPLFDNDHVSIATYVRLYLHEIISDQYSSCLYIDNDTLILDSIDYLLNMKVHILGAADHLAPNDSYRLWGSTLNPYFQAGVLVINLDFMRKIDLIKESKDVLIANTARIRWHDQDILNIIFKDSWERLPFEYNYSTNIQRQFPKIRPAIVHFDGPNKPWIKNVERPLKEDWVAEYFELFDDGKKLKPDLLRILYRRLKRVMFNALF